MIAGRSLIKRTPLDIPIALFLITACVGVWAAYHPGDAWTKFWLILASILLYYLLASLNVKNLYHIAGALSLCGLGIGIFFFLSNNWDGQQVEFQFINRVGDLWMRIRPDLGLPILYPNDIAGIAGLTLPFSLARMLECFRRKSTLKSILFSLASLVILATIVFSADRGAWMAVTLTAGLWVLWEATKSFSKLINLAHRVLFASLLAILALFVAGYVWVSLNGRINEIVIGDPDGILTENRFHVFWSAIELIRDVPFTGSGLDSFSGLYSNYILINPNHVLGDAHNIFLDISLQQGILGGLSFFLIYFGSFLLLILHPPQGTHEILHKAILSSLLIITLHNLVDVLLYRTIFTTLLFFVPGMAVGLTLSNVRQLPIIIHKDKSQLRRTTLPMVIIISLMLVGILAVKKSLLAAWYTNLGAVEMAKVELADFPTGVWDEGRDVDRLDQAESLFQTALAIDPTHPGANYRLGLISMAKRDYLAAIKQLEIAYRGNPNHRGIIKALGYTYLWLGQHDSARLFLTSLPETRHEVGNYVGWWRVNVRPDLATNAEKYLELSSP